MQGFIEVTPEENKLVSNFGASSEKNNLVGHLEVAKIAIFKGEDGGHYIPSVNQIDDNTMEFNFTPSKSDMPSVKPVSVKLPVSDNSCENIDFKTDKTLSFKDGTLSVNTTDIMEVDNTLPMTSAGVYATVGNIEALLKTI